MPYLYVSHVGSKFPLFSAGNMPKFRPFELIYNDFFIVSSLFSPWLLRLKFTILRNFPKGGPCPVTWSNHIPYP